MARNLNEDEEKEDNLLRGVESTFKLDFGRLEQAGYQELVASSAEMKIRSNDVDDAVDEDGVVGGRHA